MCVCVTLSDPCCPVSQGLFRIAPSASKLKKLKASLDCGVLDVQEYSADPHAIAGELHTAPEHTWAHISPSSCLPFICFHNNRLPSHRRPHLIPAFCPRVSETSPWEQTSSLIRHRGTGWFHLFPPRLFVLLHVFPIVNHLVKVNLKVLCRSHSGDLEDYFTLIRIHFSSQFLSVLLLFVLPLPLLHSQTCGVINSKYNRDYCQTGFSSGAEAALEKKRIQNKQKKNNKVCFLGVFLLLSLIRL